MIFDLCTEKALNAMNYLLFYQKHNLIFFLFEINGIKFYVFIKLQDYKLVYVHYNEADIILINKQLLQL